MKFLVFSLFLSFIFYFTAMADGDTLVIKLKDNKTEKIAVSDILKIQFENVTGVDEEVMRLNNLNVKENYPNPFREQTNIEFEIASSGNIEVIIYDNSGNQIQTLKCENCQAGKNSLMWNCLDKNKNKVQSGVYFYEVHFGNELLTKRMIVIK
jgi:hypothetical protein